MFPSDHVIADEESYRATIERGIEIAAAGENIVVLGIRPTARKPVTVISRRAQRCRTMLCGFAASPKSPTQRSGRGFVAAGNYFWNSGMFLWSARTLANALREHLPKTAAILEEIAAAFGTRKFAATFRNCIPSARTSAWTMLCSSRARRKASRRETFSACLPILAGTIWDRGLRCMSTIRRRALRRKAILFMARAVFVLNAHGNYVHAPGKFVAAVGVNRSGGGRD